MKKTKSAGQIIFIMICLCFIAGIFAGAVIQNIGIDKIKDLCLNESLPKNAPFYALFVKNSKLFILSWLIGFISFGIPFIMAISILKGITYGYAFSYMLSLNGIGTLKDILLFVIPYNVISSIPFFISGTFACWAATRKFIKSSKSCLRREKEKKKTEFIIIFILSLILTFISCFVEIKLSGYVAL